MRLEEEVIDRLGRPRRGRVQVVREFAVEVVLDRRGLLLRRREVVGPAVSEVADALREIRRQREVPRAVRGRQDLDEAFAIGGEVDVVAEPSTSEPP